MPSSTCLARREFGCASRCRDDGEGRPNDIGNTQLHGFVYVDGESGVGSGAEYARGAFVRGDRRLEFSVRESLGEVVYYAAGAAVAHEFYMRAKLGRRGPNEYPGFSKDPVEEFRHLAHDLAQYCAEFLVGSDSEFLAVAAQAEAAKQIRGFKSPVISC